ncbi:MAG: GNAT family protein [Verrucomicrobiota bacterium JB022]|nr:GNAT family protein [Verrucomicrobiota bacterium JB022]
MALRLKVDREVQLRLLNPDESGTVFEEVERSREHLRTWMPWLDRTRHAEDSRPFLEQSWRSYHNGGGFSLGIFYHGEFAGMAGFHAFDVANRITSLGYWLGQGFEGKGVMHRSVERLLTYAFNTRQMNRVYLRCATGNLRSRAIPERMGFVHEGCQREAEWLYDHYVDLEIYSLLRREWEARQAQAEPETAKPSPWTLLRMG